jgi:heme/copper-type cytochrome/quinol oxidase subunit 2
MGSWLKPFVWILSVAGWMAVIFVVNGRAEDISTPRLPTVVPTSPDGIQRATVILDSYSYSPDYLLVERGKPVELTLKSVTTIIPHNFIITDPASRLAVEQDVSAGQTVMARFVPAEPGRFPFFCDKRLWPLPSHRDKGMEGILEVK